MKPISIFKNNSKITRTFSIIVFGYLVFGYVDSKYVLSIRFFNKSIGIDKEYKKLI